MVSLASSPSAVSDAQPNACTAWVRTARSNASSLHRVRLPYHSMSQSQHDMSMRLLWAGTTPVHSAGARGQYLTRSAERATPQYENVVYSTAAAAGGRIGKPNGVLGGSGWLCGWMVWWYTVISRLMILRRYTKTLQRPQSTLLITAAARLCRAAGCQRDGSAVFTVRLRPRAL